MAVIKLTRGQEVAYDNQLAAINPTEEATEITFNDYQELAAKTAVYPGKDNVGGAMYLALGLGGEAGEVQEKIKKYYRDGIPAGIDPDEWIENLTKEVGDVLWYASQLLAQFGVKFSDAAVGNLEKLASRKQRGVLHGSGDNR
jgi:NTP pyrophosphatase (non-canonical NTP hydrolase)